MDGRFGDSGGATAAAAAAAVAAAVASAAAAAVAVAAAVAAAAAAVVVASSIQVILRNYDVVGLIKPRGKGVVVALEYVRMRIHVCTYMYGGVQGNGKSMGATLSTQMF